MNAGHVRQAALAAGRDAKHKAWTGSLAARSASYKALAAVRDPLYERRYSATTFRYQPGTFRRSFVNWDAPAVEPVDATLPRKIYCFWTGDNDLTPARARHLEAMRESMGIEVVLVTLDNLNSYQVADHPIHRAFSGLSYVHRSDYLRAYFMHHHGGAYADIKNPGGSWEPVFDTMDGERYIWITGYPEHSSLWVARYPGRLGRELRRRHDRIPGGGSFVARPGTQLTTEWLTEVHRRLDYFADLVDLHPGGVRGEDPMYPVSWNRLLAQVLHPLALKFHAHVRVDPVLKPELTDYR